MGWTRALLPPAAAVPRSRPQRQARLLGGLLVADVFGQRLALPAGAAGQLPLLLPVALVVSVVGVRRGLLQIDPARLALGGLAVAGTAVALGGSMLAGGATSAPSYAYLLLTYLPFVLVVGAGGAGVVTALVARYVRLATVLSVLVLLQLAVQPLGLHRPDLLASVLPHSLLLDGYNTNNPFYYGASLDRPTGFVMLEPSFTSQYLGLAVLGQLWLRQRRGPIFLFLAAMLVTLTGTGFLLLGAGLLAAAGAQQAGLLRRLGPVSVAAVAIAVGTPVGSLLLNRATEGSSTTTSTGQRFVLPFTTLVPGWLGDLPGAVVGHGAGSATHFLQRVSPGVAVVPLAPLKLLFEYGVIGGVPFLLFLAWCVLPGIRVASLTDGLVVAYLLLSASLLQPSTVDLFWLLGAVCSRAPGTPSDRPRPALPAAARTHVPAAPRPGRSHRHVGQRARRPASPRTAMGPRADMGGPPDGAEELTATR